MTADRKAAMEWAKINLNTGRSKDDLNLYAAFLEAEAELAECRRERDRKASEDAVSWAVWITVAGSTSWDSIWDRKEFANDHLNEMLQNDWGEPITASGIVPMAPVKLDRYEIPGWLRAKVQSGLKARGKS